MPIFVFKNKQCLVKPLFRIGYHKNWTGSFYPWKIWLLKCMILCTLVSKEQLDVTLAESHSMLQSNELCEEILFETYMFG